MKKELAFALLLSVGVPAALAANGHPYVAVQGTFIDADNLRNNKEGYGAALLLGLPLSNHFASEINLFGLRMDNSSNSFDRQLGGGLDLAVYPFSRRNVFSPFLLLGGGAQYEDRNGPERGYSFLNAGGGFLADLDDRVALRVDAKRYRVNDHELIPGRNQLWDTRINLGLQIALGGAPVVAPPPVYFPPPPPPVYAPPPMPAAPVYAPPPLPPPDSDADGITDDLDQCPGTLPGLRVNTVGCPLPLAPAPRPMDSDHDGVLDANDLCPGTLYGMRVDDRGCAIPEAKVVLHDINFEFDSAQLTYGARQSLNRVVDGLRGQPTMSLLIEGHTDSEGSDAYNLQLSRERAKAAMDYLVDNGISSARLQSNGYGESRPITTNSSADGRAQNRRVEFKVTRQ